MVMYSDARLLDSLTVTPRTDCITNCSVSNAFRKAELRSGSALADSRAGGRSSPLTRLPLICRAATPQALVLYPTGVLASCISIHAGSAAGPGTWRDLHFSDQRRRLARER